MWNGKMKAVTFSYDDGITQDRRLVGLFNQYGVKATFNLNSGLLGDNSSWTIRNTGMVVHRLPLSGLTELYRGHEIAAHGLTHANPVTCDDETLARQLDEDIRSLHALFGTEILGYAYPFGQYSDRVVEALAARGIRYARTVECRQDFALPEDPLRLKASYHHDHPQILEGIDRFLSMKADQPCLLYIWGHSYEFDSSDNWSHMEDILRAVSGHADVFYGTNAQVLCGVDNSVS